MLLIINSAPALGNDAFAPPDPPLKLHLAPLTREVARHEQARLDPQPYELLLECVKPETLK
jgi:hypothetical protein